MSDLQRRSNIGAACIENAGGKGAGRYEKMHIEDRETYARDAISDILTALYGPAGHTDEDGKAVWNEKALDAAQQLLNDARASYEGDSEDYDADDVEEEGA